MDTAYYIIDTSPTILLSRSLFHILPQYSTRQIRRVNRHRFSVARYLPSIDIPSLNVSLSFSRKKHEDFTTMQDRINAAITRVPHDMRCVVQKRRTTFAAYTHLLSTTQANRFLVAECHSMSIAE